MENAIETINVIVLNGAKIKSLNSFKINQSGFRLAETTFRQKIIDEGFSIDAKKIEPESLSSYAKELKIPVGKLHEIIKTHNKHLISELKIELEESTRELIALQNANLSVLELISEIDGLNIMLMFADLFLDNELTDIDSYSVGLGTVRVQMIPSN